MALLFHAFSTFDELSRVLADRVVRDLEGAAAIRGGASLVVPGGTTPGTFFDVLHGRALPWDKLTLTLTDERWVAVDSERSNERLVRSRLLVSAQGAKFVSLKANHAHAHDACSEVDARLSEIARPFDFVVTGMGDDGHTASWIPGSKGLGEALDASRKALVSSIEPPTGSGLDERITLTLRALTDSRVICVLMRGEQKRKTYETARAGRDVTAMPIRALLFQDRVPIEVFWSAT